MQLCLIKLPAAAPLPASALRLLPSHPAGEDLGKPCLLNLAPDAEHRPFKGPL